MILLKERIGILGGTFDPIHNGHIAIALRFIACLNLTELVLLPAGQPWQKIGVSAAFHRLAMTELAAKELELRIKSQNIPKEKRTTVRVAKDELERPGPSYMADTLAAWRAQIGSQSSLTLIIGDDQLAHLESWHKWQQLFDYAHIGVAHRAGYRKIDIQDESRLEISIKSPILEPTGNATLPKTLTQALLPRRADATDIQMHSKGLIYWDALKMPALSSTQLRQVITNNVSLKHLEGVPNAVAQYIFEHHLYQTDPYGYSHT